MSWGPVYNLVKQIPRGRVITYWQLVNMLKLRGGSCAAGRAMVSSPCDKGIPRHRVIGAGGRILLREPHASLQQRLLESEGVGVLERRVNLAKHLWAPPGRAAAKRKKPRSGIRN